MHMCVLTRLLRIVISFCALLNVSHAVSAEATSTSASPRPATSDSISASGQESEKKSFWAFVEDESKQD